MKVKIEYLYDGSLLAPFVAFITDTEGEKSFYCSVDSFEAAKEKLIKAHTKPRDLVIPEPEEIEI